MAGNSSSRNSVLAHVSKSLERGAGSAHLHLGFDQQALTCLSASASSSRKAKPQPKLMNSLAMCEIEATANWQNKSAIKARVQQITAGTVKLAQVTAESLVAEVEEVRQCAMESGQLSAAVAAIKEKGVLTGKRIERSELGAPGEFEALSDDELERALAERLSALGLAPDAGSDTRH